MASMYNALGVLMVILCRARRAHCMSFDSGSVAKEYGHKSESAVPDPVVPQAQTKECDHESESAASHCLVLPTSITPREQLHSLESTVASFGK